MYNHTMTQAAYRNRGNLYAPRLHLSEDEPSDGFLYLHAPRHMARYDPQMAEAVHLIGEYSALGHDVLQIAKHDTIRFARKNLGKGTTGRSIGNEIYLGQHITLEDAVCVLPHEIMHWIQSNNNYNEGWSIKSRLLSELTAEAGAETCAVQVAHELWRNDISEPFKNVLLNPEWIQYKGIYNDFNTAVSEAYRSRTENPVLKASDVAFHSYFGQKVLVHGYAKTALVKHLSALNKGLRTMTNHPFNEADAADNAYAGHGRYLVKRPVMLPDLNETVFSHDRRLYHAFKFAAFAHASAAYDPRGGDMPLRRKRQELMDAGNPFMKIDLPSVMEVYKARYDRNLQPDILAVMMEQAEFEYEI